MLPTSHQKIYQKLLDAALALRDRIDPTNLSVTAIQEKYQQLQKVFQDEAMGLEGNAIEGEIASRFQSVQTEIHRALRLLGTDILFLRSSKQSVTSGQRAIAIRDRVDTIIGFCQAMLN